MNYLAVRAVAMTSLNRQRANLLYSDFRVRRLVQSPHQVAKMERIFAVGSSLHGDGRVLLGSCHIGVRLDRLFRTSSMEGLVSPWTQRIMRAFAREKYILWFSTLSPKISIYQEYSICLEKGSTASDHLKAWVHVMELAYMVNETGPLQARSDRSLELLEESLRKVNNIFPALLKELVKAGWDVENPALLTKSTHRISRAPWSGEVVEKKLK